MSPFDLHRLRLKLRWQTRWLLRRYRVGLREVSA